MLMPCIPSMQEHTSSSLSVPAVTKDGAFQGGSALPMPFPTAPKHLLTSHDHSLVWESYAGAVAPAEGDEYVSAPVSCKCWGGGDALQECEYVCSFLSAGGPIRGQHNQPRHARAPVFCSVPCDRGLFVSNSIAYIHGTCGSINDSDFLYCAAMFFIEPEVNGVWTLRHCALHTPSEIASHRETFRGNVPSLITPTESLSTR